MLSNVKSNVNLNRGVIQLNPLTSQIYGGQQSGSVTVDTRLNPMTYAVNVKLTSVDANKMLSSVSSVKDTVYGTLEREPEHHLPTPASGRHCADIERHHDDEPVQRQDHEAGSAG